jgi:hypothetical protein
LARVHGVDTRFGRKKLAYHPLWCQRLAEGAAMYRSDCCLWTHYRVLCISASSGCGALEARRHESPDGIDRDSSRSAAQPFGPMLLLRIEKISHVPTMRKAAPLPSQSESLVRSQHHLSPLLCLSLRNGHSQIIPTVSLFDCVADDPQPGLGAKTAY